MQAHTQQRISVGPSALRNRLGGLVSSRPGTGAALQSLLTVFLTLLVTVPTSGLLTHTLGPSKAMSNGQLPAAIRLEG